MTGVRSQESGVRSQESVGLRWLFVVALILIPIFAHGCHGDDVDHEPSASRHEPEQHR